MCARVRRCGGQRVDLGSERRRHEHRIDDHRRRHHLRRHDAVHGERGLQRRRVRRPVRPGGGSGRSRHGSPGVCAVVRARGRARALVHRRRVVLRGAHVQRERRLLRRHCRHHGGLDGGRDVDGRELERLRLELGVVERLRLELRIVVVLVDRRSLTRAVSLRGGCARGGCICPRARGGTPRRPPSTCARPCRARRARGCAGESARRRPRARTRR
jgi:hypothetical protein